MVPSPLQSRGSTSSFRVDPSYSEVEWRYVRTHREWESVPSQGLTLPLVRSRVRVSSRHFHVFTKHSSVSFLFVVCHQLWDKVSDQGLGRCSPTRPYKGEGEDLRTHLKRGCKWHSWTTSRISILSVFHSWRGTDRGWGLKIEGPNRYDSEVVE